MTFLTATELLALADRLESETIDEHDGRDILDAVFSIRELAALKQAAGKGVTEELIERAAKAMADAAFLIDPDSLLPWRDLSETSRNLWKVDAEVAIKAVAPMLAAQPEGFTIVQNVGAPNRIIDLLKANNASVYEFDFEEEGKFPYIRFEDFVRVVDSIQQAQPEPSVPVSKLRELVDRIASKRYFSGIDELESLIVSAEGT